MDADGNVCCNPCDRRHRGYVKKLKNVSSSDIICAKKINKKIKKNEYICRDCSKDLTFRYRKENTGKKSAKKSVKKSMKSADKLPKVKKS